MKYFRNSFISKKAVQEEIDKGFVRIAFDERHKNLAILNYTPKTQFAQRWNDITMRCRGLVVEWRKLSDELPVIIDSPRKFFNNGEALAPDLTKWHFSDTVLTEKLDGYYISIRKDSKFGLIVTSRGSFDNKYVEAAKKLIPADLPQDVDFFCELCQTFPGDEGIIVTKWEHPELICWGVGHSIPKEDNPLGWSGKIAKTVTQEQFKPYMLGEVEGVVAFNLGTGERVKIKTQWYLDMHRIISNCTFNNAFVIISGGGTFNDGEQTSFTGEDGEKYTLNLADFPEEHLAQMRKWEDQMRIAYAGLTLHTEIDYTLYKEKSKKDYALNNNSPAYVKNVVFAMLSNKDHAYIEALKWKIVKQQLLSDTTNEKVVVS